MRPLFSVESLFTRLLRSAYSAETQRSRFLRNVYSKIGFTGLCEALEEFSGEGELHLRRLEMIAARHGIPLSEKGARGMDALIEETGDRIFNEDDAFRIDLALAGFLEKSACDLASTYRSALRLSSARGWRQAEALLDASLEEELKRSNDLIAWRRRTIASPAKNPATLARR